MLPWRLALLLLLLLPARAFAQEEEGAPEAELVQPVALAIPAARVHAPIEPVGLTEDGAVDAPRSFWSVGWYEMGALPGIPGNAVITGHVSTVPGPAVFSHLRDLGAGDEVRVSLSDGRDLRFVVRSVESFAFDDPEPMPRIYGLAWVPRLNLVTCDGEWDPVAQNYDRRLVVFTDLAEEPPGLQEASHEPAADEVAPEA